MVSHPLFYQLLLVALVFIYLLLHVRWNDHPPRVPHPLPAPAPPRRRRAKAPKPFAGLIRKPLCAACEQEPDERSKAPSSPPSMITFSRGRQRTVDTHVHFCPHDGCDYRGWFGRGNLRANGHPGGQPWRQLPGVSCQGYCSETHGTILHGKRSSADLIVRVIACLTEG